MDKQVDTLVISFKFPPTIDTSGIVAAKRIIKNNSIVDVLHNMDEDDTSLNFKGLDELINERLTTNIKGSCKTIKNMTKFTNQGMKLIDDKEYKNLYTRTWCMANNFLAMEYKFNNPDVCWTAEFSDPILINIHGEKRITPIENEEFINRVNLNIDKFNEINDTNLNHIKNEANIYYLAELLTFIFSDKLIFTNENQRKVMLEHHSEEICEMVMNKSTISHHPTLDSEYYHLVETNPDLNDDEINIAYFGNFYYTKRHFEAIFFAFDSLNHKYKDKIKFHLFLNKSKYFDRLIEELEIKENIIIKEPIDYFEFLNSTSKYDILLINDTITEGCFSVNPYLPSKFSDYKGSGSDIWAIYEQNSTLSTMDFKYKSSMTSYKQSRDVLVDILNEYGYSDEDCSFSDNYYEQRITQLNKIIDEQNTKIKRQKKTIKKLKKLNKKIMKSKSWKITKPLRKGISLFKK